MSETDNQDPVLSEDEKDALLDGVENGEVEVQAAGGQQYAAVTEFEVSPRNRIVSNSYPRLQNVNSKLAGQLSKTASKLLNQKIEVAPAALATVTWGEFCEQDAEPALIYAFRPEPLDGLATIYVRNGLVAHIVETFYGGSRDNPPRHEAEGFTPGESGVIALFCDDIARGLAETWQGLASIEPASEGVYQSTDIVEIIDTGASVICTEFDIHFDDDQFCFNIVWPTATVASLLPVLEGQKRDRDAAEDAHWERVIRDRLPDATVGVDTRVGRASMSLREVAELKPGDVIEIDNPRLGTVFAEQVPVLEGRFGVHDGCFALEATRWLTAAPTIA